MKKAIIFGASGFIGSYLTAKLLQSSRYNEVIVVVRKPLDIQHAKLKTILANYHTLAQHKNELIADDVFIALGSTKKKTPDEKEYYQIDHDYPLLAAQLSNANGAKSIFLVSALGANANSSIFYVKTKGETEKDIISIGFDHTHIFRPSVIIGDRAESRPLEKISIKLFAVLNAILVGSLNKYKGISAEDIATAMFNAAQQGSEKVKFYHWEEMKLSIK